jgi:hypothetical protein
MYPWHKPRDSKCPTLLYIIRDVPVSVWRHLPILLVLGWGGWMEEVERGSQSASGSPVPASPTAEEDDDDEKDSEITLNTYMFQSDRGSASLSGFAYESPR